VVGWALADHMRTELVADALTMAFANRAPAEGVIFHSDRGCEGEFNGRRNTSIVEVSMGWPAGWMKALTGRSPMKSPGAPALRREVEIEFWHQIATGATPGEAAKAVGVSQAAGGGWFRHRGGMPIDPLPLTGRYLSFHDRPRAFPRRSGREARISAATTAYGDRRHDGWGMLLGGGLRRRDSVAARLHRSRSDSRRPKHEHRRGPGLLVVGLVSPITQPAPALDARLACVRTQSILGRPKKPGRGA
jgi:hypothetical protein